jgi:hypothetical protein
MFMLPVPKTENLVRSPIEDRGSPQRDTGELCIFKYSASISIITDSYN